MSSYRSRLRSRNVFFPQRRLFNTSFYDTNILPVPLGVDLLIEDLFDELDLYERVLLSSVQQPSFYRRRRPQQLRPQRRPQRPQQQRQFRQRQPQITGGQIRPKSKGVRGQRTISPFQRQQGRQQVQQKPFIQQKKKMQPQQLGRQQQKQSFISPGVKGVTSKTMQQKYRICIDCRCCDCDANKITKSIKCVGGLNHLTVCAPCKSNPSKIFKRSYTLPSQVQHQKMVKSITPQGHCLLEFPLLEEPCNLDIDLMPVQKIKTPEGKKAFFVQVPILPLMDPAKVKVCIKDNCNLIVKFEHKKTIGDICSRVHYYCQVPLPKANIDVSSILCKQNKHTLNITVPVKQGGMVSTTTTTGISREIPVHRKLRHRKRGGAVGGVSGMPSATMQQQQQKQQKPSISGIQQQQKKPVKTRSQQELQQQQQLKEKKQPSKSKIGVDVSKQQPTSTTTVSKKKKQPVSQQLQQQLGQQQYPKSEQGVSKGSELLEQVFGFGGKSKAEQPSSSQQQQKSTTPTSSDVQKSQVSESSSSEVMQGRRSESPSKSDISGDVSKMPEQESSQ